MTEPRTVADWQQFLQRYKACVSDSTQRRLGAFTTRFEHLKAGVQALEQAWRERNRYRAPDFNLFRLLHIERAEVTTHSVVLADVLNPHGTHGQHGLFLRTFLHYCAAKFRGTFPPLPGELETATWCVDREKVTPFGTLDLVLSCPDAGFLLVIENKIDAGEQPDQVRRYAHWLERQHRYFPARVLLYLTPRGTPAQTAMPEMYCSLSYRHDIVAWLYSSLAEVKSIRVKETLGQYLEIVAHL